MARLSRGTFCRLFLLMQLLFAYPLNTNHDVTTIKRTPGNTTCSHDCGTAVLASPELNLTSPGFPNSMPHEFYICEWVLQGLYSHQVKVTFLTFDLPHPDHKGHCDAAFINYGGYDHQSRRVAEGTRCGTDRPDPFYASSRGAWVELVITGTAPPNIYKDCKGLLMNYQLERTGLMESQIFLIVVLTVMLSTACCCPIVWYLRNRKQNKNTEYLNHMRAEARRNKREMKNFLSRRMASVAMSPQKSEAVKVANEEVDPKQSSAQLCNPTEGSSTLIIHGSPLCPTPNNQGDISQHHLASSTPHTLANTTKPSFDSFISPMSGYGWVKVTPIALHSPHFGVQNIIGHKTGLQLSRRKRLRKLSLAFSAPSLGSICELEEIHYRCDANLETSGGKEDHPKELCEKKVSTEESKVEKGKEDENEDEVFL